MMKKVQKWQEYEKGNEKKAPLEVILNFFLV
jgi:hypothetical protein